MDHQRKKQIIKLSDYGILPGRDITVPLYRLMSEFKNNAVFVFENDDYYFSPHEEMRADYRLSNCDYIPYRTLGIWLAGMKDCELQGNGARLWFEGQMQPFTLDHCDRALLKGFFINWKKPLVAEGTIVSHTETSADVFIDQKLYPHRYQNGTLEFDIGANEWYPVQLGGHTLFNSEKQVCRNTGDRFIIDRVEPIEKEHYRFYLRSTLAMQDGSTLVLRHNARTHAGIFAEKCRNISMEDITVYSCGGLGILAQFCRNLTIRRVSFLPDTSSGRVVSNGRDDGLHLTSNSGRITVSGCSFLGLMDDPINVHGCYVPVESTPDEYSIVCHYGHRQAKGFLYWAEKGDQVSLIDRETMETLAMATVKEYRLNTLEQFVLIFSEPIPEQVRNCVEENRIAVENMTHTASFACRNNRFGSCRARGILVSTPKPVRIEKNYFDSAGSAILIAGDTDHYFESGACRDVVIRENVFTDRCMSSMYQFCEGIISIDPVIRNAGMERSYHRNIRIERNVFDTPEVPVLYAFSCEKLVFCNNRIFKSPAATRWHPKNNMFTLKRCKEVKIQSNHLTGSFGFGKQIEAEECDDLTTDLIEN